MLRQTERIAAVTKELMQFLVSGKLEISVGHTFPLAEAAEAHQAIVERRTVGKVVLVVWGNIGPFGTLTRMRALWSPPSLVEAMLACFIGIITGWLIEVKWFLG